MTRSATIRATQQCSSCSEQIPLHAWICPVCGAWVAEMLPPPEAARPAA